MDYVKNKKIVILLFCILLVNCGIYSFKGSLAPHLKTVAVPLFDNRTPEFGISEELTDLVIDDFTKDNSLKITDRSYADVLVVGQIVRVDDRAGAVTQSEQVEDVRLYISVKVTCTDMVKKVDLWEERLTQYGSYDPAEGLDGRAAAISEALEKVSEDVINKTVSGW